MSPPSRRDLFAAAWWSASLRVRPFRPLAWAGAASLAFGGCAELIAETPDDGRAALAQQEVDGWNVGGEGMALAFPGAQPVDVSGGNQWLGALMSLAARLGPASVRWVPYYHPTLFQSLEAPRNADLRAAMRPVFTAEMALASRRGEVLASLLNPDGVCRTDVAVVLDLAGPESVAVAAALAPCLDPVFVFDNWPHPAGVVPAHLTLGAALYFLPAFERAAPGRGPAAAPVFVLDRQRLAPYVDDAGQFDNRYLAGLPSPEALQAAGIRQVLYVTPDERVTQELDDLNDDLVGLERGGIDVKMLALADFSERPLPDWPEVPPCAGPTVAAAPGQLYFGGSPGAQTCFPFWYGWQPGGPSVAVSLPPVPARLAPRCRFRPAPRVCYPIAGHPAGSGGGWRSRRGLVGGGWHASRPVGSGFGRSGSMGRINSGGWG